MKKFLLPATFAVALASAAFTRPAQASKKDPVTAYYYDNSEICTPTVVLDYNCVADDLGYICMEYTNDSGLQVMLQNAFGNLCYQPYYSYYPND